MSRPNARIPDAKFLVTDLSNRPHTPQRNDGAYSDTPKATPPRQKVIRATPSEPFASAASYAVCPHPLRYGLGQPTAERCRPNCRPVLSENDRTFTNKTIRPTTPLRNTPWTVRSVEQRKPLSGKQKNSRHTPLHRRPVFLRHLSGPPSYPFGAIQSCTMGVKPYSFSSSTPLPGGAQIVPATASRTGRLFPAAAPSDMKLSKLKCRPDTNTGPNRER